MQPDKAPSIVAGKDSTKKTASRLPSALLVVMVFLMAVWIATTRVVPLFWGTDATPRAITPRGDLAESEETTIAVFEFVSPSVVFITNAGYQRDARSLEIRSVTQGSGSGIVWDTQGHIVTNLHVVQGADRLIVTLSDRTSWDATPVGYSREHDLAVLKIETPIGTLKPVAIGESNDLRVGQGVFAIGNPFGLDHSLTRGIISALHRDLRQSSEVVLRDLIQTDAAINPGNSGGPLIDTAGRLIGVNTAIISPSQASAGIGFAIPVDFVNQVVPDLIKYGRSIRPIFGVRLRPVTITKTDGSRVSALCLGRVYPRSPAANAGLKGDRLVDGRAAVGDCILAIDGATIPNMQTFNDTMSDYKVGDTVQLRIFRDLKEVDVTVTLGAAPFEG